VRAFLSLGQGEPLPRSGIARETNLLSCASCLSSRTNSRALGNFVRASNALEGPIATILRRGRGLLGPLVRGRMVSEPAARGLTRFHICPKIGLPAAGKGKLMNELIQQFFRSPASSPG
jgi:hypothetical protein